MIEETEETEEIEEELEQNSAVRRCLQLDISLLHDLREYLYREIKDKLPSYILSKDKIRDAYTKVGYSQLCLMFQPTCKNCPLFISDSVLCYIRIVDEKLKEIATYVYALRVEHINNVIRTIERAIDCIRNIKRELFIEPNKIQAKLSKDILINDIKVVEEDMPEEQSFSPAAFPSADLWEHFSSETTITRIKTVQDKT